MSSLTDRLDALNKEFEQETQDIMSSVPERGPARQEFGLSADTLSKISDLRGESTGEADLQYAGLLAETYRSPEQLAADLPRVQEEERDQGFWAAVTQPWGLETISREVRGSLGGTAEGIGRSLQQNVSPDDPYALRQAEDPSQAVQRPQWIKDLGKKLEEWSGKSVDEDMAHLRKIDEEGADFSGPSRYVNDVSRGFRMMLSGVTAGAATGAATRNPILAAKAGLAVFAEQVYGRSYHEEYERQKDLGKSNEEAHSAGSEKGGFDAATETLTELVTLGGLFGLVGKTFFGKLAWTAGSEGFGETVNDVLQQSYENSKASEYENWWDALAKNEIDWGQALYSGAVGAGMGTALGGTVGIGTHAAVKKENQRIEGSADRMLSMAMAETIQDNPVLMGFDTEKKTKIVKSVWNEYRNSDEYGDDLQHLSKSIKNIFKGDPATQRAREAEVTYNTIKSKFESDLGDRVRKAKKDQEVPTPEPEQPTAKPEKKAPTLTSISKAESETIRKADWNKPIPLLQESKIEISEQGEVLAPEQLEEGETPKTKEFKFESALTPGKIRNPGQDPFSIKGYVPEIRPEQPSPPKEPVAPPVAESVAPPVAESVVGPQPVATPVKERASPALYEVAANLEPTIKSLARSLSKLNLLKDNTQAEPIIRSMSEDFGISHHIREELRRSDKSKDEIDRQLDELSKDEYDMFLRPLWEDMLNEKIEVNGLISGVLRDSKSVQSNRDKLYSFLVKKALPALSKKAATQVKRNWDKWDAVHNKTPPLSPEVQSERENTTDPASLKEISDKKQYSVLQHQQTAIEREAIKGAAMAQMTPQLRRDLPAVAQDVVDIVNQVTGGRAGLTVTDIIEVTDKEAAKASGNRDATTAGGYFEWASNQITIAISDVMYDPSASAFHEAFHSLEGMGVFTTEEKILMSESRPALEKLAADALGLKPGDETITSLNQSELRAYAFQGWAMHKRKRAAQAAPGGIEKAFQKVLDFFQKLWNKLQGRGFNTVDSLFNEAYTGHIAERDGSPVWIAAERALGSYAVTQPNPRTIMRAMQDERTFWEKPRHFIATPWQTAKLQFGSKYAWQQNADYLRMKHQDRYIDVQRLQELTFSGGQRGKGVYISSEFDEMNFVMSEEGYTSRAGQRLEVMANLRDELSTVMADNGLTVAKFELFLKYRDAPQRNANIASVNPAFSTEENPGSGIESEFAMEELDKMVKGPDGPALMEAATVYDQITKMDRDVRVETGLWKEELGSQMATKWPHYAPSKGYAELDIDSELMSPETIERLAKMHKSGPRTGKGYNLRGAEIVRAKGHEWEAGDILANTFVQLQEAIIRGEKNVTLNTLYKLCEEGIRTQPGAENVIRLNRPELKRVYNKATGQIQTRAQPLSAVDDMDTIMLKVDGEIRTIQFVGKPDLVRNLKNMEAQHAGRAMRMLMGVSRYLSSVFTTFSPGFLPTNFLRDIQTALINLGDENLQIPDKFIKSLRWQVTKDVFSLGTVRGAGKALFKPKESLAAYQKAKDQQKDMSDAEIRQWESTANNDYWFRDMEGNGGRVNFWKVDVLKTEMTKIQDDVARHEKTWHRGNIRAKSVNVANNVLGAVENANLAIENGVRVATYKRLVQSGYVSKRQAASIAKNLTVNFNRKGELSSGINMWFLFYNASVQGITRWLQASPSKNIQKVMGASAVMGFVMDQITAMWASDEDDPDPWYDRKNTDHAKKRSLIIPYDWKSTGESYVQIPLPYTYSIPYQVGRITSELIRGRRNIQQSIVTFLEVLATDMSPIDFMVEKPKDLITAAAPALAKPIFEIAMNRNFMGLGIYPEDYPGQKTPNFQKFWPSASGTSQAVTKFLSDKTFGDAVTGGGIDVSPEALDHVAAYYAGGLGTFVTKLDSIFSRALNIKPTGKDVGWEDVPIARRLVKNVSPEARRSIAYDRLTKIEQYVDNIKRADAYAAKQGKPEAWEMARKKRKKLQAYLDMEGRAKSLRKTLKGYRDERNFIYDSKKGKVRHNALKKLREREAVTVNRFNRYYGEKTAYLKEKRSLSFFSEAHAEMLARERIQDSLKGPLSEYLSVMDGSGVRFQPVELESIVGDVSPALEEILRTIRVH